VKKVAKSYLKSSLQKSGDMEYFYYLKSTSNSAFLVPLSIKNVKLFTTFWKFLAKNAPKTASYQKGKKRLS
jgi:hypothetical protein